MTSIDFGGSLSCYKIIIKYQTLNYLFSGRIRSFIVKNPISTKKKTGAL
jgi:hypothetical protein